MLKCTYSIENRGTYLNLKVEGFYFFKDFIQFPKIILNHSQATGIYRTLFNGSLLQDTDASIVDRFFLGEKIAEVLRHKVKLAIVWPTKDIGRFMEVVAMNRAAYVRIVSSTQTALQWLMSETEEETETALLN